MLPLAHLDEGGTSSRRLHRAVRRNLLLKNKTTWATSKLVVVSTHGVATVELFCQGNPHLPCLQAGSASGRSRRKISKPCRARSWRRLFEPNESHRFDLEDQRLSRLRTFVQSYWRHLPQVRDIPIIGLRLALLSPEKRPSESHHLTSRRAAGTSKRARRD